MPEKFLQNVRKCEMKRLHWRHVHMLANNIKLFSEASGVCRSWLDAADTGCVSRAGYSEPALVIFYYMKGRKCMISWAIF